jgi:hypothetical protein
MSDEHDSTAVRLLYPFDLATIASKQILMCRGTWYRSRKGKEETRLS